MIYVCKRRQKTNNPLVERQSFHLSKDTVHCRSDSSELYNIALLTLDMLPEAAECCESTPATHSSADVELFLVSWACKMLVQSPQRAISVVA